MTESVRESKPAKVEAIEVRLTASEKETFGDAARLAGISLSSWVRERLRWAAIRELQEAARPVAVFKELD